MKKIDDNLVAIFNAMFKNKNDWKYVTDKQKNDYFFIINRLMSKFHIEKSQLLNNKSINRISAMDTWFIFMMDQPYPKWFWSKSKNKLKYKEEINEQDILFLSNEYNLKYIDIEYLINIYPQIVKEEIEYFRKIKNSNK